MDTQYDRYNRNRQITLTSILSRWRVVQKGDATEGVPVSPNQAAGIVMDELAKEITNHENHVRGLQFPVRKR